MLRRVALYLALLLYVLVALPVADQLRSAGDVALYLRYANAWLNDGSLPKEYPPISVLLFVLPRLVSGTSPFAFHLCFTLSAAAATALLMLLMERAKASAGLLLALLLGAFGTLFFRYDVFVAALAVAGFSVGMQRKWLSAQLLLALAAALKLYPLLLMPLLLILQQRAERKLPWRAALTGGGALLLSLFGTWWLASEQVVRMLGYHRDRPVEFESLPACALWLSGEVTAKFSFGSWNLLSPSGPGVAAAFALLTLPLVLAIYVLLWRERLTPAVASTAVLLALLLTSKVFSSQYMIWILPFAVLAHAELSAPAQLRALHALAWLLAAWLTAGIFPLGLAGSHEMLSGIVPGWLMGIVLARNAMLLVAGLVMLGTVWASRASIGARPPGG